MLDYLVDGVMAYHPGSETKSPTLIFTQAAPADPQTQRNIVTRIKPAARLLTSIACATIDAANTLLTTERTRIARDVQALDDIRSRMGIDVGEDLDDLRARYAAGEAGIEQPDA